ncbi:MAG: hypothetical protein ACM35H_00895, partial [Bacteroidota bacterium]
LLQILFVELAQLGRFPGRDRYGDKTTNAARDHTHRCGMKYLFDYRNSMIFSFHGLKELPPDVRNQASSAKREERNDK